MKNNNEIKEFLKHYKFILDKYRKYENKKYYYKSITGWHLEKGIKIMKNIGQYKVGAVHFDCNLPYSNYYIIDTVTGKIYELSDIVFFYGYNGKLKEIIRDLQLAIEGKFIESLKPKEVYDWDPLTGKMIKQLRYNV